MEQPERALSTVGSGAQPSRARLRGEVVLRDGGAWSGAVLALLRHFEDVGFDGAPRVVGDGLDAHGRELLTYLPGSSPHPYAWPDPALPALGALLRRAHDAGRSFVPGPVPGWRPWFGRGLPGDDPVIGHGDPGPWNVVAGTDGLPYALIDWEFAGPGCPPPDVPASWTR